MFQKIIIENFQGLQGVTEYDLTGRILVRTGPNGTGKTSFANAVRYVLTGEEPKSEVITKGADRMSVTVFTEDGHAFTRSKSREKGNKCYIDKKQVTQTVFAQNFSAYFPVLQAKTILSSDFSSIVSPKELEELILKFFRFVKKEELYGYTEGVLPEEAYAVLDEYFTSDKVTLSDINEMYKKVDAQKRECKKSLASLQAYLSVLQAQGLSNIMHTPEELEKSIKEKEQQYRENEKKKIQLEEYRKAEAAQKAIKEKTEWLQKEIQSLPESSFDRKEQESLEKQLAQLTEEKTELAVTLHTVRKTLNTASESRKALESGKCPLSEDIQCTTDKSGILAKLSEVLTENEKLLEKTQKKQQDNEEKVKKTQEDIQALQKAKEILQKKETLKVQLEAAKGALIALPEKPEGTQITDCSAEIAQLKKELDDTRRYMEYVRLYQEYTRKNKENEILESIRTAYGAKGIVKQKLVEGLCENFENACNKRGAAFHMTIHIRPEAGGLQLGICPKEDSPELSFHALSGGEKARALYVILSVFAAASRVRALFMDELSILDPEGIASLVEILKKEKEEYDIVVLCSTGYDEIVQLLLPLQEA